MAQMHKDYDKSEFAYDRIVKAWMAINGINSDSDYFFVGHLQNPQLLDPRGCREWMAYNVRPQDKELVIVPFDYVAFREEADAEEAIFDRVYNKLGWRIQEMNTSDLPWENSLENKLE